MDLQAIVMAAGKGSRIMEVTSGIPKCLLPVGNIPVIKACLQMLSAAGIQNIIIVVSESERAKVQDAVENKCGFKVDVVAVPKNEDWGTADSLRFFKDKIHSDFIVVSCDLLTNFDLRKILIFHRKHDSTLTMLMTPWPQTFKDAVVPGRKEKHKQEKDIVGMDDMGRLIFFNSEADFEEGVPMKLSVLNHHPVVEVRSDLMDAHVYVMKRCVLDFIISNKNISTLKGEFLPVIVAKQFSKKHPMVLVSNPQVPSGDNHGKYSDLTNLKKLAMELSSWNNHDGTLEESYCGDMLKCFAFITDDAFCIRANSLLGYYEANKHIAKNFISVMGVERKPSPFPKSQVTFDCIIGDECELLPKCYIKQSIVGNHCQIKEKAKVSMCLIMDGVVIETGANVQSCIICSNVTIGKGSELKNCVVGPEQTVNEKTKLSNELVQRGFEMEI